MGALLALLRGLLEFIFPIVGRYDILTMSYLLLKYLIYFPLKGLFNMNFKVRCIYQHKQI